MRWLLLPTLAALLLASRPAAAASDHADFWTAEKMLDLAQPSAFGLDYGWASAGAFYRKQAISDEAKYGWVSGGAFYSKVVAVNEDTPYSTISEKLIYLEGKKPTMRQADGSISSELLALNGAKPATKLDRAFIWYQSQKCTMSYHVKSAQPRDFNIYMSTYQQVASIFYAEPLLVDAQMFACGEGIVPDYQEAYFWYQVLAQSGYPVDTKYIIHHIDANTAHFEQDRAKRWVDSHPPLFEASSGTGWAAVIRPVRR